MTVPKFRQLKILSVIGTRPEVIKMAPIIKLLSNDTQRFRSVVCGTGQHREMLTQMLDVFGIAQDINLDVMTPGQSLSLLSARLFERIDSTLKKIRPDWVLAQGDTTSVFVAAMSAFYHGVRFAHIEAGLRTRDLKNPFPEEANRRTADMLADLCCAPTETARQALLKEGCLSENIVLTGNTVVDALNEIAARPYDWASGPLASLPKNRRLVLVTAHRRESFGEPMRQIGTAMRRIAEEMVQDGIHLVYPVHLNPEVRQPIMSLLRGVPNVSLLEPLEYLHFIHLMKHAEVILTDSGGIQEEAPSLGVPVLVMRDRTERPEGIEAGIAKLVGTNIEEIVNSTIHLLRDPTEYAQMKAVKNPYGDGRAAERIVAALLERELR